MGSLAEDSGTQLIQWRPGALEVTIRLDEHGAPCIEHVVPAGVVPRTSVSPYFRSAAIPLTQARIAGQGHTINKTAKALVGSVLSSRLQYVRHVQREKGAAQVLDITTLDRTSGLQVIHTLEVLSDAPVLRSSSTIRNTSESPITLTQASSLSLGGLTTGTRDWWQQYSVCFARNTWFREAQWQQLALSDAGLDDFGLHALHEGHRATMARFSISNRGSLSTETYLPMGALTNKAQDDTWLWQIEHNGSWRWEVGEWQDGVYIAASGPTLIDHAWQTTLEPGESFVTVPVAVCHIPGSLQEAFAAMNQYRRCLLRPSLDHERMPIIFNDYMNCLMGDPTEDKILALLSPAANCGAEYFVIDAGWYADDSNWWDDVGLWEPSKKRFPSGFRKLLQTIREKGLSPGVWLEPEVVGTRSILGTILPDEAFFQECGARVEERGRYQLDYSQSIVREHMDKIIDRLVLDYGVRYFKFDYNIEVMTGTDALTGISTGSAHLKHQRAYVRWVADVLDRHLGLVVENCSSGGQRMDYCMLAVHTIQSTSDQQDPFLYAAIAAACPTAVLPEQSASWAYPQREWSDEKNAATVINSLMGRVHLSGRLDALEPRQYELIREGMAVYRDTVRDQLRSAKPFWSLGLPRWHDDWISLGMGTDDKDVILAVWRRSGATSCRLPLPKQYHRLRTVCLLYPVGFAGNFELQGNELSVDLPDVPCARLLRLAA